MKSDHPQLLTCSSSRKTSPIPSHDEKHCQQKDNPYQLEIPNMAGASHESTPILDHPSAFAPVGYLALSHTGIIIEANATAAKILGIKRNKLLKRHFASFISASNHDLWHGFLLAAIKEGAISCDLTLHGKSNTDNETICHIQCIRRRVGHNDRFLTTVMDITEHRCAEEKLHQAKEHAEQSTRAKSEFLSNMSHEIRTPINVVLGLTDVLLETELTPDQRQYMEILHNSGGALMGLINDILDFSRIESGRFTLVELPFFPRLVLDETIRIMQLSAEQKGLTLMAEVGADVPDHAILGDDGRLRQILINLIGNAVKFTEQGHIHVCLGRHHQDPNKLLFTVSDTGIGIPSQYLEQIFDRFTQADSGITRRHGGTGLGLAISRKLVELMGGTLWVESVQGDGSTFFFTLPLKLGDASSWTPTPAPSVEFSSRSLRILLAEDSKDNQMLFQIFLKKTPHHLEMVNNGSEAVERVQQENFDLVLMDIQMPIMDGYTATRIIRQWEQKERRPPLFIIALSAHASLGKKEESLLVGCDDYFPKPIKKQTFLAELDRYARLMDRKAVSSPSAILDSLEDSEASCPTCSTGKANQKRLP